MRILYKICDQMVRPIFLWMFALVIFLAGNINVLVSNPIPFRFRFFDLLESILLESIPKSKPKRIKKESIFHSQFPTFKIDKMNQFLMLRNRHSTIISYLCLNYRSCWLQLFVFEVKRSSHWILFMWGLVAAPFALK